jgi:hypothetical protein
MDFSIIHEHFTTTSRVVFIHFQAGLLAPGWDRPNLPSRLPCPEGTTDGGYEVGYRLQWRDRPGFSPGSLFSLTGTLEMFYSIVRGSFYSHGRPLSKEFLRTCRHGNLAACTLQRASKRSAVISTKGGNLEIPLQHYEIVPKSHDILQNEAFAFPCFGIILDQYSIRNERRDDSAGTRGNAFHV